MSLRPEAALAPLRRQSALAPLSGEQMRRAELAELFRIHHTGLVKVMARRLRCGQALAEDACAHAWLQLWRKRPDDYSRLVGWLYVVALHEGYRLLAIRGRESPGTGGVFEDYDGAPLVERIADPRSPELTLEAKEALEALGSLTRRQRDTLALQVAGYSFREIQAIRGGSYTKGNRCSVPPAGLVAQRQQPGHARKPALLLGRILALAVGDRLSLFDSRRRRTV